MCIAIVWGVPRSYPAVCGAEGYLPSGCNAVCNAVGTGYGLEVILLPTVLWLWDMVPVTVRLCCIMALWPSLVGVMRNLTLLRVLETKVPRVAGQGSPLSLSMMCTNWSHLVMTPVILIGNVQPRLVRLYMYIWLIIAERFSMRHIIVWVWWVLVGSQSDVVLVCMYVCVMCVCMNVLCMYVCMYVLCVYVCIMCVCMYVCMFVCLYVCMYHNSLFFILINKNIRVK